MGNADTKLNFRKAVIQLTTKTQPVDAGDDTFWDQESKLMKARLCTTLVKLVSERLLCINSQRG